MSAERSELVWELTWFSKKTEELEGERDLEYGQVDVARVNAIYGFDPGDELIGGVLHIQTPEAVAYFEGVSGLKFDLANFDYFIGAVRP